MGLDDGCSKDREQEISCCVSKCDVEVSSKSHEIESTNNSSSLPQSSDLMSATQTDFYLGSLRATSLDSTLAREQEISVVSKCYSKSIDFDTSTSHRALVTHNIHLTCLEGDPVGTSVGLTDGDFDGLTDGY